MVTLLEREEISRGLAEGLMLKDIAAVIGREPSVVSREVARHGGRLGYRAAVADAAARVGRSRPKGWAVERSPALRGRVLGLLRQGWSPASIAGRLPIEHPQDKAYRVSHEAIYSWIYATPVSSLARELIALRSGRTARRGGPAPAPKPRIKEPTYIDQRPAEATGRAVPGHWEGDLVIGKAGKTAVATLVERTSRFLVLVPLTARDAPTVSKAIIAATGSLPEHLRRSLT
ncbi:MAG: IS30 family transposase [Kineosporiaceae bacterium]